MRLFIAVPLPKDWAGRLSAWAEGTSLRGARWVFSSGLHVTLQFLGDTAPGRRTDLDAALAEIPRAGFDVDVRGLGAFPGWRRPRVLWAGIARGAEALKSLSEDLGRGLAAKGFTVEKIPFVPHITLARFSHPPRGLEEAVAVDRDRAWGAFRVDRVGLFESVLTGAGARYEVLREVRLA